jgi:hypothetical protein
VDAEGSLRSAPEGPGAGPVGGGRRAWPLRLVGSLFGVGAGLVGLLSLLGLADQPALNRERALGSGVALVVGAVALVGSLAARDVHALWYCTPRRWRQFRGDL